MVFTGLYFEKVIICPANFVDCDVIPILFDFWYIFSRHEEFHKLELCICLLALVTGFD